MNISSIKYRSSSLLILLLILIWASFLRFWYLSSIPVSLFGDELDVGYHAYSILKTGKDYSGNFMPMHFRSLAEWRTPLYIYSAVPTVALFGISPLGVRLPAAVFGVLGVWLIYLLVKRMTGNSTLGLLSAFFLSISPWHLQYSRAGFEVTEMLFFYMAGIYALLRGFKNYRWLFLSVFCLGLTPWVYNTAKLFLPLTMIAISVIWWKELKVIPGKYLLWAIIIFTVVAGPFTWNTLFGGGTQRIEGISIFNDPTVISKLGFNRLNDIKVRDKNVIDISQVTLVDKLFHNQPLSFLGIFMKNYFQSYSTEFLFIHGDISPRHSSGTGEFYKVQAPFLLLGLIFLLTGAIDKKTKLFLVFWLLASPIPSSLTKDGGTHATRLILILPPLILLVSLGVYNTYQYLSKYFRWVFIVLFSVLLFFNFVLYQHNYLTHYPWQSQIWWHAGFKEAIQSTVLEGQKYDKAIISGADEPPLIFFLGWSAFPPLVFQQNYPLVKVNLEGVGEVSKLNKYYFPPIGKERGLYELGKILPKNTLYLTTAKEIKVDLIKEPGRVPSDLILIKSFSYPSGEPAFYLFTKSEESTTTR